MTLSLRSRSTGCASTPWRYRSISPSTACSSVSACGIVGVEEALHLGGVDQQRGEAAGARSRAALGRNSPPADAALEHLLDQAPRAQDDLVKVEPGQLGEVRQLALDHAGDAHHLLARASRSYIRRISSTSSSRAEPS